MFFSDIHFPSKNMLKEKENYIVLKYICVIETTANILLLIFIEPFVMAKELVKSKRCILLSEPEGFCFTYANTTKQYYYCCCCYYY